MADEDLTREIERLWSRVGGTPLDPAEFLPPPTPPGDSPAQEAAWEAVSLLKRAREIVLGVPALLYWQGVEGRRAFAGAGNG